MFKFGSTKLQSVTNRESVKTADISAFSQRKQSIKSGAQLDRDSDYGTKNLTTPISLRIRRTETADNTHKKLR